MPTLKKSVLAAPVFLVAAVLTLPAWKPAAKRFKWFIVATNVYQDTLRRTGLSSTQIGQMDFSTLPESETAEYVRRINTTFDHYRSEGGLTPDEVRDGRVLEIGPGETLGVALRLIGAGAAHVTAIDKFVPLQTSPFHRTLYRTLGDGLSADEQARVARAVDLASGVRFNPAYVSYVYGKGVEDAAASQFAPQSFDLIVSNAVLEEVYDLDRTFAVLDRVLKAGGRQIHVIDLRDYGMFTKHGFHPLEFLTIPDGIYRHMVESSGQPNRRLIDYYRRTAASLGYRSAIYATRVLGRDGELPGSPQTLEYGRDYSDQNLALVRAIRPRLLPRYRLLSDQDLLVQSIVFVARKPEPGSRAD